MAEFKNRIVGYGFEKLDAVLFHPDNWRIHPARQQEAVNGSLAAIGWVETVIINIRSSEKWANGERGVRTLIDGHLRVTLAGRNGETEIPVTYVDLDPQEEDFILTSLDPLGALAVADNNKLLELRNRIDGAEKELKAAMRGAGIDNRASFAHLAEQANARPHETYQGEGKVAQGSQEKYPLAIVLDRRDYEKWATYKASIKAPTDSLALKALLNKAIAEV